MNRHELDDLLGAYASDALDDETRDAVEAGLRDHADLSERVDRLRGALAPLGHLTAEPPAEGLADSVLGRALDVRAPGRPVGQPADASIEQTYRSAASCLREVLSDLAPPAGAAITVYRSDVTDLVRHLAAVEHLVGERLGLWPATVDASVGHIALGGPEHGETLRDAAALWSRRAEAIGRHLGELEDAMLERRVEMHGIDVSVEQMLVIRAFEVWSHSEDVCRAVERAPVPLPAEVIRTMANQAIDLLRFFMSASTHRGKTVRITLTGPGGGSWPYRLGSDHATIDPVSVTDATVVADAVDFCRVFADRVDADAAVSQRLGDEVLLDDLLATAPTFADYGERIDRG